jgi:hypothetical protein
MIGAADVNIAISPGMSKNDLRAFQDAGETIKTPGSDRM